MRKIIAILTGLWFWPGGWVYGQNQTAQPEPEFHLYLLIGQSNMAGRGEVDEISRKADPRVEMLTKNLTWKPAVDPLHFDKKGAGVGPGLAFGKAMAAANPQVRIGLVPCAVGGTSINVWCPGAVDKSTHTHPYDDMLQRIRQAQKTGVLKGILWHQGESDRGAGEAYGRLLTKLIAQLRQDLNAPDVPFVAGELSNFQSKNTATTEKNEKFNTVIESLAATVKNYGWVSGKGLNDRGDRLHYDTESARILGQRYAQKMLELQKQ